MTASLRIAGFAVIASVALAASAGAQSLLDDLLPARGTCTCGEVIPPNDCSAALAEPRALATEQRRQIRAQCATQWRSACEEQYGWQSCSSQEANTQLATECDAYAEGWYSEIAAPQINDLAQQCDSANASWIEQCETVVRPQNCSTCDDMGEEIAQLEADIAEARSWVQGMRNGAAVLTPEDEGTIAQRVDEIDRWERDLGEKLEGYTVLQNTEYCPRS